MDNLYNVKIFENLGYEIVEDEIFSSVINLSAQEAFNFSSIVGSNYLIDKNGISVKGRNEVFIHRSVFQNDRYIYSPGLFGRDIQGYLKNENQGSELYKKYKNIFIKNKKLILYQLDKNELSNIEEKIYKKIRDSKIDPSNYLLFKFRSNLNNMENFLEWVSSHIFINKGYIFENQCPFFQQSYTYNNKKISGGIPDVSAFKSTCFNILEKYSILNNKKGLNFFTLPHLVNFNILKYNNLNKREFEYQLILGEVKSKSSSLDQAINQLNKYSKTNLAEYLYTIIPDCSDNLNNKFGEIFLENNELNANIGEKCEVDDQVCSKDNEWLQNYIKISLLGNFPTEHLSTYLEKKYKTSNFYSYHLIDYGIQEEMENILDNIYSFYGLHK